MTGVFRNMLITCFVKLTSYAELQSCHCEEPFDFAQDKLRDVAIYPTEIASHSFAMTSINRSLFPGKGTGYPVPSPQTRT